MHQHLRPGEKANTSWWKLIRRGLNIPEAHIPGPGQVVLGLADVADSIVDLVLA